MDTDTVKTKKKTPTLKFVKEATQFSLFESYIICSICRFYWWVTTACTYPIREFQHIRDLYFDIGRLAFFGDHFANFCWVCKHLGLHPSVSSANKQANKANKLITLVRYSSLNEKHNYQLSVHYERAVELPILKSFQCLKIILNQISTWYDCDEPIFKKGKKKLI